MPETESTQRPDATYRAVLGLMLENIHIGVSNDFIVVEDVTFEAPAPIRGALSSLMEEWVDGESTAQHPAAPETETDANGVTEAELQVLMAVAGVRFPEVSRAVERIVAERVRVVEGERDAEVAEVEREHEKTLAIMEAACDRADAAIARAESAEAAHEAEKAAHERLRAGVEALADEWAEDYPGPNAACNRTPDEWATDLRSLLGGGEAR